MSMFGLCALKGSQNFSLKSLSVDCNIRNLLVSCTATFTYKNDCNEDIEGLFSFPLDANCVVYHFEAVFNTKSILGVCKEIEEARNMYKAAKELGHQTALIEQSTTMADVFNCSIGNFPKLSEVKIILKFAMELKISLIQNKTGDVDRFDLCLPLILRPRYTPGNYKGDTEVYLVTNKYEYHFKSNIIGTKSISNITSVNHKFNIEYQNEGKTLAEITLLSKFDGTKDLDISIEYIAMREPSVIYEPGTASSKISNQTNGAFYQPDVAMVNFLPKVDSTKTKNQSKFDIVFIVDRSGSMDGSNIARARECLLIFLKSLPVNCKFQIYGFGSTFDKAFNDSQLYNDQSINIALTYQKNLNADFGGTELTRPLQDMYNSPLSSDYTRVAFLLTDGDVGNQDEVTGLVRKHNKTTRLFTVGIGDGVSTSLVDQVARAGLGKSAFVRNSKELSAIVIELLDVALTSDQFTNCKLDWQCPDHVSIVTIPNTIPPIFSGYFVTVFCMINGMTPSDIIRCTLTGNVNGQAISYSMEINDSHAVVDDEYRVHRMLAKYKIDEMTIQIKAGQEDLKKDLIDLSTKVNIVTNWTTFVAIDPDLPNNSIITNIPDELSESGYEAYRCSLNSPSRSGYAQSANYRSRKPKCKGGAISFSCFFSRKKKQSRHSAVQIVDDSSNDDDVVFCLVKNQNIDGSWDLTEEIISLIGLKLTELEGKKPSGIDDKVWATVIVYHYLEKKLQSREREWRLIAKKAKTWVEENLSDSSLREMIYKAGLEMIE